MLRKKPLQRKGGLKRASIRRKLPTIEQRQEQQEEIERMHNFMLSCWDAEIKLKGEVRCYETGKRIPESLRENSMIYHHCLEKQESQYPQFRYEPWNICFLLPEIHSQVHHNIEFTPRVQELTKQLKEQYG